MIKVKAYSNGENKTNVDLTMDGLGSDLIQEALAIVGSVFGDLAENAPDIHRMALIGLSLHPEILLGSNAPGAPAEDFLITKIFEGVN